MMTINFYNNSITLITSIIEALDPNVDNELIGRLSDRIIYLEGLIANEARQEMQRRDYEKFQAELKDAKKTQDKFNEDIRKQLDKILDELLAKILRPQPTP